MTVGLKIAADRVIFARARPIKRAIGKARMSPLKPSATQISRWIGRR